MSRDRRGSADGLGWASTRCRVSPLQIFRQVRALSTSSRPIKVLALESSADDSCASIVDSERRILSNIVIKQHEVNAKWGGIHPREAQLAHAVNLPKAVARALKESRLTMDDIDAIGFTRGPGMPGCLHVCGNAARAISAATGKPIYGVHHMQAHTLTPLLTEDDPPKFPFLTLLVSGGHTQIVLAEAWDKFTILADSLDSRVGNAVDRIARYIQLPQSPDKGQGAMLEEYAALPPLPPYDSSPLDPVRPAMGPGSPGKSILAFSFSGMTTSAERLVDRLTVDAPALHLTSSTGASDPTAVASTSDWGANGPVIRRAVNEVNEPLKREVARVYQEAIMGHIAHKVGLCFSNHSERLSNVTGIVMSGGVASNGHLRLKLQEVVDDMSKGKPQPIKLYYPPIHLCTDNAAMIAWAAIMRIQAGHEGDSYDLMTRPKWSLETLYDGQ